jgi:uncharacterized protein (DUF1800 family)
MPIVYDRRTFLRRAALLGITLAGGLGGCSPLGTRLAAALHSPPHAPLPPSPDNRALFAALNRLTFGPRSEELARAAEIGLAGWIEEQLAPERIDDTPCDLRVSPLDTLRLKASDLFDLSSKLFANQDRQMAPQELRSATLIRQIYSRRQLFERMVEFWGDHFNISVEKGDCFCLKTVDDRSVLRPHALGSFRDLLWASAHSPAMLVYLDNASSDKATPNENYARELMELHTLGVGSGYTQQDVMQLARCLTGWGVKEHFWKGEFEFQAQRHAAGSKTVLGLEIPAGGQDEAEAVLEMLAEHPAAANFITRKLARRFLSEQPPENLIERGAQTFLATHGDLRAVLRLLLLDGLPHLEPRYRRPADFVAAALRQLDAETSGGLELQGWLARMGMPYFAWPTPDGYPDRSAAWQGSLTPRWQFALALAGGEIPGVQVNFSALAESSGSNLEAGLAARLLGAAPQADLSALLFPEGEPEPGQAAALISAAILSSPAYQWK